MDIRILLGSNWMTSPVIAFGSGIAAIWDRSDLKFPEQVYQALTIYLLLSIGFKGGEALSITPIASLVLPLFATLLIGTLISIIVFFIVRRWLKMGWYKLIC